ncbi:MAG: AEC family transporter [Denitrovibrio sp.]|nr:MAG: AEC family transporter [Denitrovibrio sp.]
MIQILQIVLPVFIVLFIGWFIRQIKLIDDDFIQTANKLIFNVCLPVLLFYKIALADLRSVFSISHLIIMFISIILMFVIAFVTAKAMKLGKSEGTFAMNTFRANYAYMGLPVSAYAFGDQGLVIASVLMAFVVPMVNFMSVVALSISMTGERSLKPFIKNTLLNPLAIACLLGIAASWFNIGFPVFIARSLEIVSGVTLPLALFCVGGSMSRDRMKGDFFPALSSSFLKLLVMPFCAYLMLKISGIELSVTSKTLVIMLSAPTATVNYVLASQMQGDAPMAGSTIVMSTLLSILSFSLWLFVLGV